MESNEKNLIAKKAGRGKGPPNIIMRIETSLAYGRGVLRGIARYSRLYGPWVFYCEAGDKNTSLPEFGNWNADGIIAHVKTEKDARKLLKKGLPAVFKTENPIRDLNCIISDCQGIGKMGAEYLIEKGFRNFAYCGYHDNPWSDARGQSFGARVKEEGGSLYVYDSMKKYKSVQWKDEQVILAEWIKSLPKPIGLMACHDIRARHVVEACKISDIRVPDDVAVLGVDNDEVFCDLSNPALSSISLNTEAAGFKAAELLSEMMQGKDVNGARIYVEPQYVVTRQSTDTMAIDDRAVLDAIRFIEANIMSNISVNDVVNAVAVSRTVLQKKFNKVLGRTVYSEIKRTKIDKIASMLRDTERSISEIATDMGFTSGKHIARYFSKEKGVSLRDYRDMSRNR